MLERAGPLGRENYAFARRTLGPDRAAPTGALCRAALPACTVLEYPARHPDLVVAETPDLTTAFGLVAAIVGVAMINWPARA